MSQIKRQLIPYSNIENEGYTIEVKKARRLGKVNPAKTRPILVEFQTFDDKEIVRKACPNLKDTDFAVSQQFTREVVLKRRKLLPILKTARNDTKNAFSSIDKRYINGELYTSPEA